MDDALLAAQFDRLFTAAARYVRREGYAAPVTERLADGRYEVRITPPGRNGVRYARAARLVDAVAELATTLERLVAEDDAENDALDAEYLAVRGAA